MALIRSTISFEGKGWSRNWRCIRQELICCSETGFLTFELLIQNYIFLEENIVFFMRNLVNGAKHFGHSSRRTECKRCSEIPRVLFKRFGNDTRMAPRS